MNNFQKAFYLTEKVRELNNKKLNLEDYFYVEISLKSELDLSLNMGTIDSKDLYEDEINTVDRELQVYIEENEIVYTNIYKSFRILYLEVLYFYTYHIELYKRLEHKILLKLYQESYDKFLDFYFGEKSLYTFENILPENLKNN